MRILFVVDGQSPHSQGWIKHWLTDEHEVHVVSTYPVSTSDLGVASVKVVPLDPTAKVRAAEKQSSYGVASAQKAVPLTRLRGSYAWKKLASMRDRIAPIMAYHQAARLRTIVRQINPDIVHAMRIPFEGIMATIALEGEPFPLIISTWGNDFTLYAESNRQLMALTKRVLRRADALHPDCKNDLNIAHRLGFCERKPAVVLPGNGGLNEEIFYTNSTRKAFRTTHGISQEAPIIVNPRGLKPYIRNDLFFEAAAHVLRTHPSAYFVGVGMEGKAYALEYVKKLNIEKRVILLPALSQGHLADLLRESAITLSLGAHDGTPNSVIEAMSCGSFPIALDIPSLREWIDDHQNGFLVHDWSPDAIARSIVECINNPTLLASAQEINSIKVSRWSRTRASEEMKNLYRQVAKESQSAVPGDKTQFQGGTSVAEVDAH